MKKIFFFTVIGLVFIYLILISIISLEPNPITLNFQIPLKSTIYRLTPQGWAFFTKDPKEDYFEIYKESDNHFFKLDIKSSSKSQFYGVKRENRAIMHKINHIIKNVDKRLWYEYEGNIHKINSDSLSTVSVIVKEPMIYGEYLISKGKPLPYDWFKSKLNIENKMMYVRLIIRNEK